MNHGQSLSPSGKKDIFKKALDIINDPSNGEHAEERKWFLQPHKHDENKPPETLENLFKYMDDKSKRLNSGIFSNTVRYFRQSESGLRHLAIVVDSVLSMVPDPAGGPAGAVFGIIKFTLKLVFNHRDLIEKVCIDFNMILQKIETVNWTLASYRSDPRIRCAAVKLYVSILSYWCRAWHLLKEKRHVMERMLHFPDKYEVEFENLKADIVNQGDHLRDMMLTISLERAKDTDSTPLTPDTTAKSHTKSVSVLTKKLERRYPGTCSWIEDSPTVLEWLDTRSGKDFLWIHALAGAGKSVTAAYVVDSLISHRRWADENGICLFFFCEHSNLAQASHQEVVKALLLQVLQFVCPKGRLRREDKAVFERLHEFEEVDFVKLDDRTVEKFGSLLAHTVRWGTIWIVLDGIDEYEDSEIKQVLQFLARLCVEQRSNMKVMIFSRPERFIFDWLQKNISATRYIATEIPADKVRHDLGLYAKSRVMDILEHINPPSVSIQNEKTAEDLIHDLLSTEVGDRAPLFLWVSEMIKAMELATDVKSIRSLFGPKSIPNRLYGLYARSLMRIEMTHSINIPELDRIFQLLCWAVYSRQQPLGMGILKAISVGGKTTAAEIREWIDSTCSSLFVWRLNDMDHLEDDTLHFLHLSVKELLRQPPNDVEEMCRAIQIFQEGETYKEIQYKGRLILTPEKAHKQIFDDCISFLLTATDIQGRPAFEGPLVTTRGDAVRSADISRRFPFFPYAAKFWSYHLVRTGECGERSSRLMLEKFVQSPNIYPWMEGMISFEGGTQWLRVQASVISTWLRDRGKLQECPHFRNWAKDVLGRGFNDYEPTLRYNPNDIHFLDRQILFRNFVNRKDWVQNGTDVIIDLQSDGNLLGRSSPHCSGQLQASPTGSDTDGQRAGPLFCRHGTLVVPSKPLELGESDEEYGFIILDRNRPGHQGLLMIDRRVNDPRLAWKCVAPEPSKKEAEAGISPKGVCLESKIETCIKVDPHKLWLTLSAAVDYTGSMLAAAFAEQVPSTDQTPSRVRLKTILWRFAPENPQQLVSWKKRMKEARSGYIDAVNDAFAILSLPQPDQASRLAKARAVEQVARAHRTVRAAMSQRPSLPSHVPCQRGDFWATREELYLGSDDYDRVDTILNSRYLLAFRSDDQLITPRGLWDIDARHYSVEYTSQAFQNQFVAVPGGDDILQFHDPSLRVLDILDPQSFRVKASVYAESLGNFARFERIVDCSDSGRLVALTLINAADDVTSLVVIDLYQTTYKVLLDDKGRTDSFQVRRFFFCPKDAHGTIICSTKVIQERFEWFVVEFPRGIVRQFRCSNMGVSAVYCTREDCSYNGPFHSISSTPVPVVENTQGEERFATTFREALFGLDEQQNVCVAVQRWKAEEVSSSQGRSGRHQQSCGIIGVVWADRKVTIEEVDLRHRRGSSVLTTKDDLSFRKQTCRANSVTLDEVAAADMLVEARVVDSRRDPGMMKVQVKVSWFLWYMDSTSCTVDADIRKTIAQTLAGDVMARDDMAFSGLSISPDLEIVSVWIGRSIWFLRVNDLDLDLMKPSPVSHQEAPHGRCVDIRYNMSPTRTYAVAIWSSHCRSSDSQQRHTTDALLVYSFQDGGCYTLESEIDVDCKPRWYCFSPTMEIMAVTTTSGLRFYDMTNLASPVLLREIPRSAVEENMRIKLQKADGGKASPPSTRDSLSTITEAGQDPLYFSTCGRYIFARTWDIFANLSDILDVNSTPRGMPVLDFFAAEIALSKPIGGPWAQISPQHPRVMYEDVLYSAGQQRFKIFRIRTYISLGWSADGSNYFVTCPDQPTFQFTWYRRVLCAIPKGFASWSATLLWPSETSSYRRLVVIMFPTGGDTASVDRPKVIFTPVTGESLVPDESYLDDSGTVHLDGWIRSQAAGCAYHLRHDPGAKKVEVPKAASINGVAGG
ncbi:hypothetical protein QBC38DRAFT_546656 [Podospora fimiseda]|uniref:NACHT domain-containing protein n=1 Tax=Podospora fimiseda TaxID=252190 RepID=A0AAN7BLT7_9PEZI|nr:hypothetical protein QBC38DRAFT_546656 [Podospora fimiseda]